MLTADKQTIKQLLIFKPWQKSKTQVEKGTV